MEGACGYRGGELQVEWRCQGRGDWHPGHRAQPGLHRSRIIGASGVISWGQEKAEAAGFGPALRPFLRGQRLGQSAQGMTSHVLRQVLGVGTQGKW